MKFMNKWGLALLPALAVATPALALDPPGLSDSQQPGSVIVFPKFVAAQVHVDGNLATTIPQTEIELGAVCPPAYVNGGGACPEHQPIKVRMHWVCPGAEAVNSNICPESDFDVFLSVYGKVAFSADGIAINSNSPPLVPPAPCMRGYLIGWVIDPANDLPVKFDGLIGNAVIRNGELTTGPDAGFSTAVSAYSAITIQADPTLAYANPGGSFVAPGPALFGGVASPLIFDGGAGHYTMITSVQIGDVKFDRTVSAVAPLPDVLSKTAITFLTLDIRSNQPNNPTFVNLDFTNESLGTVSATDPASEHLTSSFVEFVCWVQAPLSGLPSGTALTQAFQTTRKGIVVAGPAVKMPDGNAPADDTGEVTLIGLVETVEGTALNGFLERKYNFNMSTDGFPVATSFVPLPRSRPPAGP
jgi:hypothetical protein